MADEKVGILSFKVSTYARNIYLAGTYTFDQLIMDNPTYVTPVTSYAGKHFTLYQIDDAYGAGWITYDKYVETLSYVPE